MNPIPIESLSVYIYSTLIGGTILMVGLENCCAIVPIEQQSRLNHIGRNIGLWLFTLTLVDHGLVPMMNNLSDLTHTNFSGLFAKLPFAWSWLLILGFLTMDLMDYLWHLLEHKNPWLWRLHAVHHSDPDVDFSTNFRIHPAEAGIALSLRLIQVTVLGIPLWFVILRDMIRQPLALFHHANIAIPSRWDRAWRWLLITPALHKIHHSPYQQETDSNYGQFFSIWDRLFGTLVHSKESPAPRYGLPSLANERWQKISGMLLTPFQSKPFR